jgi:hypothetical protein
MRGGFGLPDTPQQQLAGQPWGKFCGGLPETRGFLEEPFLESLDMFETAALLRHRAYSLVTLGGSATGVLITDESQVPCGDRHILGASGVSGIHKS